MNSKKLLGLMTGVSSIVFVGTSTADLIDVEWESAVTSEGVVWIAPGAWSAPPAPELVVPASNS